MKKTPTPSPAGPSAGTRRVFALILVVLTFGMMMAAGEIVLRVLGLQYIYTRVEPDPVLHHVHPPNFSYVATFPTHEFGGHTVLFDADGLPVDPDGPIAPEHPVFRVAFMGDSFVEAINVPYEESFVGLLQLGSRDRTEVRNYGVSSYSPVLYRLQWEEKVRAWKPTHVFLMLYGNDVWDDNQYKKAAVRDAEGRITAVPGPRISAVKRLLRKSYMFLFFRKYERQVEWMIFNRGERRGRQVGGYLEEHPDLPQDMKDNLLEIRRGVEATGARFVLTAVPSKYVLREGALPEGETQFCDKVQAWCRETGTTYIDLEGPFSRARAEGPLFFDGDIHFNPAGHRVTAEVLRAAFPGVF